MDSNLTDSFIKELNWDNKLPKPYGIKASEYLLEKVGFDWRKGITLTAPGFYAPQGRELRLKVKDNTIIDRARIFKYKGQDVTNFEMETSALYIISAMLGHNALTVCDIIANRVNDEFNPNYKESMLALISQVIERISKL
jgi:uridine phosphorylase